MIADCGHGVGTDLLTAFVNSHHRVMGFSPSSQPLNELKERYACEFEAGIVDLWKVDLGDDKQVNANADRMLFSHGTPDLLLVNLGSLPSAWRTRLHHHDYEGRHQHGLSDLFERPQMPVWDTPAADWARMFGDVKGMAHVLRRFVPAMVERGEGSIVTVTHTLDPAWGAKTGVYRACCAAVHEVMETTRHELPAGMVAATVNPGQISHSESVAGRDSSTWASAAVPFLLGLTPKNHHAGAILCVPFIPQAKQTQRSSSTSKKSNTAHN